LRAKEVPEMKSRRLQPILGAAQIALNPPPTETISNPSSSKRGPDTSPRNRGNRDVEERGTSTGKKMNPYNNGYSAEKTSFYGSPNRPIR
jgi:hypothetical protein